VLQATPVAGSQQRVEEFKENTARKIRDLRCPDHHQAPRLRFQGATLRDINIQLSGCCEKLISLANEKIAAR
jgi:hypothetical protein